MSQVILRRTKDAAVSISEAAVVVASSGRILSQSGNNMLAEVQPAKIRQLTKSLQGWIVSPQAETIPVPDTRPTIKSRRPVADTARPAAGARTRKSAIGA